MKILVTGAGGYIGTTLVPLLLSNGHHVKAVDRFFFGKELLNTHDNLEFVYEDARHIKLEELDVAGSNPVTRPTFFPAILFQTIQVFCRPFVLKITSITAKNRCRVCLWLTLGHIFEYRCRAI